MGKAEERQQEKGNDFKGLLEQEKENLSAISKLADSFDDYECFDVAVSQRENTNCPYGLCDGSGIIAHRGSFDTRLCKCMTLQIAKRRLQFAEIPKEFQALKVNDFRLDCYQTEEGRRLAYVAKKLAIAYIKKFEDIKESGRGFYFYSQTKGSGKTRLMASMGNALINTHFQSVRFLTMNRLLDEIKNSFDAEDKSERYGKLMEQLQRVDILMLDDFGAERPTEWVNEVVYTILNERMTGKKITFFTSNSSMELLNYGERILSRVAKMAMPVKFPEESIRWEMAREENESMLTKLMEG